jgi:acetylornithine deacetylase/succinyl-diaminopimelate desuccinylase-like protein
MNDQITRIFNAVVAHKDEIIEFVQSAIQLPSLANDEGHNAHAINEYVEIDDILKKVEVVTNLIVNWCEDDVE